MWKINAWAPKGALPCPAWARGEISEHFPLHLVSNLGKSNAWGLSITKLCHSASTSLPTGKGCNSLHCLHRANALFARKRWCWDEFLLLGLTQEHAILKFAAFPISLRSWGVTQQAAFKWTSHLMTPYSIHAKPELCHFVISDCLTAHLSPLFPPHPAPQSSGF